jgi:hypothetical protein
MVSTVQRILVICGLLLLLTAGSVSSLYAQVFNPVNRMEYPIEFTEWTLNGGVNMVPKMQSYMRSCTIMFNSGNTTVSFGNMLYKATYIFFPDSTCETVAKALFIKQSVFGTGEIERSGRDFTIFLSVRSEVKGKDRVILTRAKGTIKQQSGGK